MEANHEDDDEIRIMMMSNVEENTRKLYHHHSLKTLIQEDPDIVRALQNNHFEVLIKLLIEILLCHDTGKSALDTSLVSRRIEMLECLLSISDVRPCRRSIRRQTRSRKSSIRQTRRAKIRRSRESECESNGKTMRWWQIWKKDLSYKGNWLQDVQGTLMLVATVIATLAFQGAIDPLGGVWQEDRLEGEAGVAIMAYKSLVIYRRYLIANSISFLASVSVILLIVSGFPLRNRIFGGLLKLAMCVAVAFLTFAFINGTAMVSGTTTKNYIWIFLRVIWYVLVGLVGLCCIIIPSLVWLLKNFIPKL